MSRAGYGASSRLEGRNVAAAVDDTRTVLDALGRDSYVALGWSGGGPHALACAALDAPRCVKGRHPGERRTERRRLRLDRRNGSGRTSKEFALAKEGGPAYEEYMETTCAFMAEIDKDNVIEMMAGLLPDADREVLADDEARELFATGIRYGFAKTWRGYFDDNVAFPRALGLRSHDHCRARGALLRRRRPHGAARARSVVRGPSTYRDGAPPRERRSPVDLRSPPQRGGVGPRLGVSSRSADEFSNGLT